MFTIGKHVHSSGAVGNVKRHGPDFLQDHVHMQAGKNKEESVSARNPNHEAHEKVTKSGRKYR
jgi:hypothetical protein